MCLRRAAEGTWQVCDSRQSFHEGLVAGVWTTPAPPSPGAHGLLRKRSQKHGQPLPAAASTNLASGQSGRNHPLNHGRTTAKAARHSGGRSVGAATFPAPRQAGEGGSPSGFFLSSPFPPTSWHLLQPPPGLRIAVVTVRPSRAPGPGGPWRSDGLCSLPVVFRRLRPFLFTSTANGSRRF